MNDFYAELYYINCAQTEVDLLRARLGIPAPVKFVPKQKAQAAIPTSVDLVERPSFLFGMFFVAVVVMVISIWSAQ